MSSRAAVLRLQLGGAGEQEFESREGVVVLQRFLREAVEPFEDVAEDGVEERLFCREAAVERRRADAGGSGDLVHARLQALVGEEPAGGVEDPFAVGRSVAAQLGFGRHS